MITPSITATYEGQPLDVLNGLIEKRERWLHETYKQSVSATAITALKSVRALTETHYGKEVATITEKDVTLTRRGDIHTSFKGKDHKRCFRAGADRNSKTSVVDIGRHCIYLVPPGAKSWEQASVWMVHLSKDRLERWPNFPSPFPVVAMSEEVVLEHVRKRFSNIAKKQSGLARTILGALMGRLSTRPPASEKAGAHVSKIVNRFGDVQTSDTGNIYSVHAESNLAYALDAVRGGFAGV